MSCVTELSELQSALPMKYLSVPVQKLNIVLMCVILTSAEHVKNFVKFTACNTLYD